MVASIFLKSKLFIFTLLAICISCSYMGNAQNPAQIFTNALFCFNNKLFFSGCNRAYRLNQYGDILVPPEATDEFCNGPCLSETELVLKCIDKVSSSFLFYNKATSQVIRDALHSGCSYTSLRGRFSVEDYITSNSYGVVLPLRYHAIAAIAGCCLWLLRHI